MKLPNASLGLKLNVALLTFVLLLGLATSAIILYGFSRTQDNATERSREALEEQGKLALQTLAGGVTDAGVIQFESASAIGQRASRYLQDYKVLNGTPAYDTSRLTRLENGVAYDPDPSRTSDVVVVNNGELAGGVLDDIAYTAALDSLYPALIEPYPGEFAGDAYRPIAMTFVGVNGVGRIYPPIGVQETTQAQVDVSALETELGLAANPERKTVWTVPYEDQQGRGLVMTAVTPVYDGDTFRGIFEVDLSIARLVDLVNALKPTETGFTFYVDSEGAILQTSAFDLLSREAESNAPLADILDEMSTPVEGREIAVEEVTLGGREYFIAYNPMLVPGGSLAVAAPVDELTDQAAQITAGIEEEGDRTFLITLGAMAALFVVGLMGATYLNRRLILAPLGQLITGTRSVAAGDLDTKVVLDRGDELGDLADSFNAMVEQLRESERALEKRVEERTLELRTLLEVSRAITSTLELRPVLDAVLDELKKVIPYDGAGITLNIGDELRQVAVRRPPEYAAGAANVEHVTKRAIWRESEGTLDLNKALIIRDVNDDSPEAVAFRDSWGGDLSNTTAAWVRSMIVLPLAARDRMVGNISIGSKQANFFSDEHINVVRAVAGQAASAIENARLYEQTEQRTRETQALLEVSRAISSTLELEPLLGVILDQAGTIIEHTGSAVVMIREGEMEIVAAWSSYGTASEVGARIPLSKGGAVMDRVGRRETVIIDDIRGDEPIAVAYRSAIASTGLLEQPPFNMIRSWMGVPLIAKDSVIGMLTMSMSEPGYFTEEYARLMRAFADLAAIAIEHARLFDSGQQLAALEERQRLARELHDSVSQALYGISLGAGTALTLLEREPLKAIKPTEYVLSLAEAGLAEMRALIFELRPESLESEGLVAALEKQIAATQARYGIKIMTTLEEEPNISLQAKEALYRVGQEALHNIVKHSQATEVSLSLGNDEGCLVLVVADNGVGFDPERDFPGHLGLKSMRERMANQGGTIEITSGVDSGTTISVGVPLRA